MQVVEIKTESLIPYINNAKTHPEEQISQIAASIREFGFNNPILTDGEKGVIAGHGRLLAAKKLGLDAVPVIELSHLTDIQKRAYILADNRLSESGGSIWDMELVKLELESLDADAFDIALTGFDLADLGGNETEEDLTEDDTETDDGGGLRGKFGIPPFSVLNAREGWWQDRKRQWISLGIKSELGRGADLIENGGV